MDRFDKFIMSRHESSVIYAMAKFIPAKFIEGIYQKAINN